jgi:hypothetical protein
MGAQASHAPSSPDRAKPSVVLALKRSDAASALGVSDETFDRYVRPSLPVVRLGSARVYPVAALDAWLAEHALNPSDEMGLAA